MNKLFKVILGVLSGFLAALGLSSKLSKKKSEEIIQLDDAIKEKDKEVAKVEKKVKQLESKKKINKKEVAKLKRKVTTTKKQIEKAKKAVEIDDVDEAVNFLKKFSK